MKGASTRADMQLEMGKGYLKPSPLTFCVKSSLVARIRLFPPFDNPAPFKRQHGAEITLRKKQKLMACKTDTNAGLFGSGRNYCFYLVLCGVQKSYQCAGYMPQCTSANILMSHCGCIYDSPSNEFQTRLQGKKRT